MSYLSTGPRATRCGASLATSGGAFLVGTGDASAALVVL